MAANLMRSLFASSGKLTLSASRSDFPSASNETGPRARPENQRTDSVPMAADSSKVAGGSRMARGTSVPLLSRLTTSTKPRRRTKSATPGFPSWKMYSPSW